MTVALHTLGCKVNQTDGEALLAALAAAGYTIGNFGKAAHVYIVNTCTVTHTTEGKCRQWLRRARRQNPQALVVLCGCMARQPQQNNTPLADFTFDTRRPHLLLEELARRGLLPTTPESTPHEQKRTRAYLKIQDGCDRFCTYCIVPHVRGALSSRPLPDIIKEATHRAAHGTRELVLTGIQLAAYGHDTNTKFKSTATLPDVIQTVAAVPGLARLRLSSLEPCAVTPAFLQAVAAAPTLCPHFHLSLQSGCDATLARMGRRYTTAQYTQAAEALRALYPAVALTTDIIVGFPGETDHDFAQTLYFARRMAFARIHVFEYSPRAGTPAADYPHQVPPAIKQQRGRALRTLATELQTQFLAQQVGRTTDIIIEAIQPPHTARGHTPCYCPVQATHHTAPPVPGAWVQVRITGHTATHLIGSVV